MEVFPFKQKIICPHCGKEFVIEVNGADNHAAGFFNIQDLTSEILEKNDLEFGVLKGGDENGQRKNMPIKPND